MKAEKKITVHVPEELLEKARKQTGQGITATVRQGLRLVAASETYEKLQRLRGKVPIVIDLQELRKDRQ
jgi:Arc/MetJ-type ribon-helix-helix transcriptional regulator